jgi:hypothetical protein
MGGKPEAAWDPVLMVLAYATSIVFRIGGLEQVWKIEKI